MAFNIEQFIGHFESKRGFSKAAKFHVVINSPPALGLDLRDLTLQCETAELPGYNINTLEGRVYGASYAVPQNPVFNELTLTFICAADLSEKRIFDYWMDVVMPKGQYGYRAAYRDDIVANIEITSFYEDSQYPSRADKSLTVRVFEAFPTSVAAVPLSWGSDDVNRLTVTFKYSRWDEQAGGSISVPVSRQSISLPATPANTDRRMDVKQPPPPKSATINPHPDYLVEGYPYIPPDLSNDTLYRYQGQSVAGAVRNSILSGRNNLRATVQNSVARVKDALNII